MVICASVLAISSLVTAQVGDTASQSEAALESGQRVVASQLTDWAYDGTTVVGRLGTSTVVWDAQSGERQYTIATQADRVSRIQLTWPHRHVLISSVSEQLGEASRQTAVSFYAGEPSPNHTFENELGGVFSANADLVATVRPVKGEQGERSYLAVVRNASTGDVRAEINVADHNGIPKLRFSWDGTQIYTYGEHAVVSYEIGSGEQTGRIDFDWKADGPRQVLRFDTRSSRFMTSTISNLEIWDMATSTLVREIELAPRIVSQIGDWAEDAAFLHDGKRIAVVEGYAVRVWDIESGRLLRTFMHPGRALELMISPDDSRCVVAWGSGYDPYRVGFTVWNMQDGSEVGRCMMSRHDRFIGFAPDSGSFLVGGEIFSVFNARTSRLANRLDLFGGSVDPAMWTYDDRD